MKGLLQDVQYGLRAFRRAPGFTALAVLTLALGIGANTTIFSWINSTLLNPIPGVKDASQMVSIDNGASPTSPLPLSYPDYVDLRDRAQSFSGMIASDIDEMGLTGIGKPEHIWGSLVSANYFDVLGVQPVLGRGFFPADEQKIGGAPIVVISYRLWQTHFAGDKSIVGKSIDINLHRYQVVGVAPPLFQGSQTGLRAELWIPLSMREQILPGSDVLHNRNAKALMVLGRMKPGASAPQAQQEVNLLMRQIAEQYPESHKGNNTLSVYPLWRAPYGANAYFYFLLPMLLAIAGIVLLLACANVANLLLVRAVARRREVAIRLSMGADRWRLVRQFLVESVLLALLGGAGAMLITVWTSNTLGQLIPPANIPISMQVHVDRTVLLAALFISLLTGVIFGVLPAFRSSGLTPVAVLKEESGSTSGGFQKARLSSALVVTQISLSLLLLICAGLFIRSFQQAQRSDPGFNSEHVLLASMNLYAAGYKEADGLEFQRQLLAKVSALPGVQSATIADWVPLGFSMSSMTMKIEGYNPQPHESMDIQDALVGPNYFSTMEIPLVAGHEFTAQDSVKSQPAAIVNQAFVDRFWAHQDAIGKRVYADGKWYSVVGVARNSSYSDLGESPRPFVYFSSFQDYYPGVIIHARVSGDPMVMAPVVEKAVHELNSGLPVYDVTTLKLRTQVATTGERIAGAFAGAFGFIALVLAAIGIYGVIAYTTRQRTHEFGIRFALGAQKRNVFGLVLRQGLRLTVVGVAIGLALAFAITRFLSSMLYGVSATDSLTFIAVIVLLSLVALGACYLPARRAAAIDPLVALRYE